jgi:hypothetical protein
MSEQEKNAIREHYTGGMKVTTERFHKLIESKLGDTKPLVNEQQVPNWHSQDLDKFLLPLGYKKRRDEKFKTTYWSMGELNDDANYITISFDQSQVGSPTSNIAKVGLSAVKDRKELYRKEVDARRIGVQEIVDFAKKYKSLVFPENSSLMKEQSEVKVDIPTIQKLFKEKGYKFEPQSGYSLYAHKETDGPIQDRKTGNYYWNYETYIPTKPGNQLWIDRRRGDGKSGTESENIIINLNGPEHSIQHRQNGKLIKQEKLNTQSVLDMINNYVAKF